MMPPESKQNSKTRDAHTTWYFGLEKGMQWPPAYEGIQGPVVTCTTYPTEFRGGDARRKHQEKNLGIHRAWEEDLCPRAPNLRMSRLLGLLCLPRKKAKVLP